MKCGNSEDVCLGTEVVTVSCSSLFDGDIIMQVCRGCPLWHLFQDQGMASLGTKNQHLCAPSSQSSPKKH
eukprot:5517356-Amphidinium_carterae.1